MISSRVKDFLDQNGVSYEVVRHAPAYTAQQLAAEMHVPGREFVKAVVVKLDGRFALAATPAHRRVDPAALARLAGATVCSVAAESEFESLFPDCERGAMPPFGNLYDLETFVDLEVTLDETVVVNAGTHAESIRLAYADFGRLVQPRIGQLAYGPTVMASAPQPPPASEVSVPRESEPSGVSEGAEGLALESVSDPVPMLVTQEVPAAKKPAKKPAPKRAAAKKKPAAKKPPRKPARKKAVAKTPDAAKRPARKKAAPKRPARKPARKKTVAKRPARKPARKKAVAKRPARKPARKKAASKKPARKPARKKAASKKPARKPARKKAVAKKRTAKMHPAPRPAKSKAAGRKRSAARPKKVAGKRGRRKKKGSIWNRLFGR